MFRRIYIDRRESAMPELPDLEAYLAALRPRVLEQPLARVQLANPFLLRSVEPPVEAVEGKCVRSLARLGKRLVFGTDGELFLVLHLMIAGRLQWKPVGAKPPGRVGLATFEFPTGTLVLTEAGSKRRASLHVVAGAAALAKHDPGGVEPLAIDAAGFAAALRRGNHTLKRALADPRTFAGIGNAFSDEILHRARRSPFALTRNLDDAGAAALHAATRETLGGWRDRLVAEAQREFPTKVTAFRPEFAVHGKYGQPCPVCQAPVQRIVYAENECNYCPGCQTDGKVLADRSLSRLLKDDWPRTVAEWEELRLP